MAADPRLPTIAEATQTEPSGARAEARAENRCVYCGEHLAVDQEWCLACGSARTLIQPSPNWRIPIAIVATVVLLALAAFAIALVDLSAQVSRTTQTQSAASKPTTTSAAPVTQKATPQLAAVASWPSGVSGWTVQLAQRRYSYKAFATARSIGQAGVVAGVLNSSDHPSMTPGYWVVFAGRYPDQASARAAALSLRAKGYPSAHSIRVAPPGGI